MRYNQIIANYDSKPKLYKFEVELIPKHVKYAHALTIAIYRNT